MLFDKIVDWGANPPPVVRIGGQEGIFQHLAARLKESQRFVLQREAVMMIHNVTESTPKRFLDALSVCRMPFPRMWVEFEFQHRAEWMRAARLRGVDVIENEDASPPSRLGFYFEQIDPEGHIIDIHPGWVHPNSNTIKNRYDIPDEVSRQETISLCFLTLRLNLSPEVSEPTEEERKARVSAFMQKSGKGWSRWVNDPTDLDAAVRLEGRIKTHIPSYMENVWAYAATRPGLMSQMESMARFDLASEWRFALSLLIAMNSRNIVALSGEADLSKLNKARAKRKAPPLLSYRDVRLSLSKVQRNRLGIGAAQDSSAQVQTHLVRGHLKLRKNGLFWWNPHIRGAIGPVPVGRTYVVTA
jgi:hypothetical protein